MDKETQDKLNQFQGYGAQVLNLYYALIENDFVEPNLEQIDQVVVCTSGEMYAKYMFEGYGIEDRRLIHPFIFLQLYGLSTEFNIILGVYDSIYTDFVTRSQLVIPLATSANHMIKNIYTTYLDQDECWYDASKDYGDLNNSRYFLDYNYRNAPVPKDTLPVDFILDEDKTVEDAEKYLKEKEEKEKKEEESKVKNKKKKDKDKKEDKKKKQDVSGTNPLFRIFINGDGKIH